VALDDFGAGASSFGYLKSLPVDCLKISGQFVRGLVDDALDDAAVRCFVDVARVVGVHTVAERVEEQGVLRRLAEIGVDYAQGYLLHRPEPLARLLVVGAEATIDG
jgi:EAL domain-containing protein (putative c-di-GMP-specific phosphodiesterase class I)